MRRTTPTERYHRRADLADPKLRKDYRALQSLIAGGSIAEAAAKSGWSVSTLYRRGVVEKYEAYLTIREASNHRAEPDRGGVINLQGIRADLASKAVPPVAPASPNRAHEA